MEEGGSYLDFSGGSDGKESACNVRDLGSVPGPGRSPGEGNGNTLLGEFHGQRSLVAYSHASHDREGNLGERKKSEKSLWEEVAFKLGFEQWVRFRQAERPHTAAE